MRVAWMLAILIPVTVAGVGCTGVVTSLDEPSAVSTGSDASLNIEVDATMPDAGSAPDARASDATVETLSVQFDTTANGGPYAPANIVAVWIVNANQTFQKTIGRWADVRTGHLVAWTQASGIDTDAISGATRLMHTPRLTATWDLKNKLGQVVPDGIYTIRMELADANATLPAQNRQGTFTFNKNGTASTQQVAGGGFLNVSIQYSGR